MEPWPCTSPCQVWNSFDVDAMVKDPNSGFGNGAGFIFQYGERILRSDNDPLSQIALTGTLLLLEVYLTP